MKQALEVAGPQCRGAGGGLYRWARSQDRDARGASERTN